MNINFYEKSMENFIILSVMWYERLTQMLPFVYWLVRVQGIGEDMLSNMLSFINFELLELYWTYFLTLQTTSPKNSPDETHELGSWAKNEMLCHELELWALIRLYSHEFWTMGFNVILWIWILLGFKRDFPKIHDGVDLVRATNEMNTCGVKILPLTGFLSLSRGPIFLFFTNHNQPHEKLQ